MPKFQFLIFLGLSFCLAESICAQPFIDKPVSTGGNPVGIWEADKQEVQAYVPAQALALVPNIQFTGSISGRLTLEAGGRYQADYIVNSQVSLTLVIWGAPLPIALDVADTTLSEGTYQIQDSQLVLVPDNPTVASDTLSYTVEGDSLQLVVEIPLGQFAALAAGIIPPDDPPLAVLSLKKVGEAGGTPVEVTADFNGDGVVDFADFLRFAGGFGKQSGEEGFDAKLDLSGDGVIDFADFLSFAGQFGLKT